MDATTVEDPQGQKVPPTGATSKATTAAKATTALLCTLGLAGCGSSALLGSSNSTTVTSSTVPSATTTTVPTNGEVAVAYPVVPCADGAHGNTTPGFSTGWKPTILLAPVPTSLVGKVTFYSDGVHTVLAPKGWTCSSVASGPSATSSPTTTTTAASSVATTTTIPSVANVGQNAAISLGGGVTLAVYPSSNPIPPVQGPPSAGTEGVFATFASTSTNAGIDLVCPYVTLPAWQSETARCATTKPTGEQSSSLTPDVTGVTDPQGLMGGLAGSGGSFAVTGVVIVPQDTAALSYGNPVTVAAESCSLSDSTLCPTILTDFEVREFPVPVSTRG